MISADKSCFNMTFYNIWYFCCSWSFSLPFHVLKCVFYIQLINNGLMEMKHVLEFRMLNTGFLCSPNTCQLNCEWSYNSQILLVYSCHWIHLLKSHLSVMSLFTGQEALCWILHNHCLPRAEERGRVTSLHVLATSVLLPSCLDCSNTLVMVILVWAQGMPGPLFKTALQLVIPNSCWCMGLFLPTLHAYVLSFMWFPFAVFSSLLMSYWMAPHLSYQPPSSSFVLSAKGKKKLKTNMYFHILSFPTSHLCNKDLWKLIAWNWSDFYVRKPWRLPRTFMKKGI